MKLEFRIRICTSDGEKFFGEGPYRLLRGVERRGSLRAAAGELGMAYSKANRILERAELALGGALTERRIGGADGGGSALTPLAREVLARYEALCDDCAAAVEASFARHFGALLSPAPDAPGAHSGERRSDSSPTPSARDKTPVSSTASARRFSPTLPTRDGEPCGAASTPEQNREEPCADAGPLHSSGALPRPELGCVVLAAGRASRFPGNKLLAKLNGRVVLDRTLDALPLECFSRVAAVTREPEVSALCRARGIAAREYPGGALSDSIREGLTEMEGTRGCLFLNGDQPLLRPDSLRRMVAAFAAAPDCALRLAYGGVAASPVLIPASAYPALRALEGECGGMAALRAGGWEIRTVEARVEAELWDIDDASALRRAEQWLRAHDAEAEARRAPSTGLQDCEQGEAGA